MPTQGSGMLHLSSRSGSYNSGTPSFGAAPGAFGGASLSSESQAVSGSGLCDALAGGASPAAAPRALCSASDASLSLLLVTSSLQAWEAGATMCTADYILCAPDTC